MTLKIVEAGHPVFRQKARQLSIDEIRSQPIRDLIELMRETMRDAPGVGLAAPQIGLPLQLAVIEDREELFKGIDPAALAERERRPVPFHVIVNPTITVDGPAGGVFESFPRLCGFSAHVPRPHPARIESLAHNDK